MSRHALPACALALAACTGAFETGAVGGDGDGGAGAADAGSPYYDELDKDRAAARFVTTTDLMRYVVAPGCAAETNECHSNEDYPDMHTEGNLWNLVGLPCNLGVGDRETIDGFCERQGDTLRVTGGAAAGFEATIGSIRLVTTAEGEFDHYELELDRAATAADAAGDFEIVRGGGARPDLGAGGSLELQAGSAIARVRGAGDLPDPTAVYQGDENRDGVYGDGSGVLVVPGDARGSYLVRRLFARETERPRMPLNANADNPTEQNRNLSPDEMYAIMSWINCMLPEDTVYSPIRYDCAANADNEGVW